MKPLPLEAGWAFRCRPGRRASIAFVAAAAVVAAVECPAQQVIYYSPVVAAAVAPAPAYVANYTPAGNYAAVTAYSPPVIAAMPTSSVAVTSYYAPALPAPAVTTTYYAPPAAVVTPVTTYYAPAAVAVPFYRRGLFGRYRPAGTAIVPAY